MLAVSACAWSLADDIPESLARLKLAGFDRVDLRPDCWAGVRDRSHLESLGLSVACVGITPITLPPDLSLDALATPEAGRVLPYLFGALERGAALGAQRAYMVTPLERRPDTSDYMRSMERLADAARRLGLKLCLEPHPDRALASCAEALEFVRRVGHESLYVLLDLGHNLITEEDPAQAVRDAGDRLGYVHIDDNDGVRDIHLGLFDGVLKPQTLTALLDALAETGYDGPVAIELKPTLRAPLSSLVAARDFIVRWAEAHAADGATARPFSHRAMS